MNNNLKCASVKPRGEAGVILDIYTAVSGPPSHSPALVHRPTWSASIYCVGVSAPSSWAVTRQGPRPPAQEKDF